MSGPTYTYNSMTPNAPDRMNDTQPIIMENFQAIQELLQVNHAAWADPNASTNLGMHNFLTLPFPSTATTPASTDINMFSAATGSPNAAEIFIEFPGSSTPVQISNMQPSGGVPAGTSGTGWSQFSASGLIFKWGTGTITIPTSFSSIFFFFPTGAGIPAYQSLTGYVTLSPTSLPPATFYGGVALYNNYGTPLSSNQASTDGFYVQSYASGTFTFNWFAVGI